LAVLGPQGVGKSSLVNAYLDLNPQTNGLPVNIGEGESVPVLIMHSDISENFIGKKAAVIYPDLDLEKGTLLWKDVSYSDGRYIAVHEPQKAPWLIWFAEHPSLALTNILVTPGYRNAKWWTRTIIENAARLASWSVLVFDTTRLASTDGQQLLKIYSDLRRNYGKFVIVVTHMDEFDKDEIMEAKRDIKKTIKEVLELGSNEDVEIIFSAKGEKKEVLHAIHKLRKTGLTSSGREKARVSFKNDIKKTIEKSKNLLGEIESLVEEINTEKIIERILIIYNSKFKSAAKRIRGDLEIALKTALEETRISENLSEKLEKLVDEHTNTIAITEGWLSVKYKSITDTSKVAQKLRSYAKELIMSDVLSKYDEKIKERLKRRLNLNMSRGVEDLKETWPEIIISAHVVTNPRDFFQELIYSIPVELKRAIKDDPELKVALESKQINNYNILKDIFLKSLDIFTIFQSLINEVSTAYSDGSIDPKIVKSLLSDNLNNSLKQFTDKVLSEIEKELELLEDQFIKLYLRTLGYSEEQTRLISLLNSLVKANRSLDDLIEMLGMS